MKKYLFGMAALSTMFTTPIASAVDFEVEIANITNGIYYTPFLAAAHPEGNYLFRSGQPASPSLQAMAEGGDISSLMTDVNALGATVVANPAGGLLAPANATTFSMNTDGTNNTQLSIVAMLLPTNDGFAGLNAITIPSEPGTYVYNVSAYDAGTEANDEIVNGGGAPGTPGIPAAPGGFAGSGGTGVAGVDTNTNVHIHRGNIGDSDVNGGKSDVNNTVHRWLNPVVRVTITVN